MLSLHRCAVDYQQKSGHLQACFGHESLTQKGGLPSAVNPPAAQAWLPTEAKQG